MAVGFVANAGGNSVPEAVGMVFGLASLFFCDRLFGGEPLKMIWLLVVTLDVAELPLAVRSDAVTFVCVLASAPLLTVDQLVLSRIQKKPLPRETGESHIAVWDSDLDRRNQELMDDYERSKGALIFDDDGASGSRSSPHRQ